MIENWKKYKINQLCKVGSSKRIYRDEYVENGIPFFRSKEIILKHSDKEIDEPLFISEERFLELSTKFGSPKAGDVLLTAVGTLGVPYLVKEHEKFYFKDGNLIWFSEFNNLLSGEFLFYWLLTENAQNEIDSVSIGSTQRALTIKDVGELEMLIPDFLEQEKITESIRLFDCKIQINNKISKRLEELIQLIYKLWFIDFEFPTENGLPYKSSGGEMIESKLGLIPKGWEITKLACLVKKQTAKTSASKNKKLIDMAVMPSYSICLDSFEIGDKLKTNIFEMKENDFLYGSIRPYLGKFGIAPFDGITTGTIHIFSSIKKEDYSIVAGIVFSKDFNDYCIKLSHGTKMPVISWNNFVDYNFAYNSDIATKFNSICRNYLDLVINNANENIKLAKMRDLLLPKLMSGEIRIKAEE